eukprot:912248-Prorocentrum_minimum.AAC.1
MHSKAAKASSGSPARLAAVMSALYVTASARRPALRMCSSSCTARGHFPARPAAEMRVLYVITSARTPSPAPQPTVNPQPTVSVSQTFRFDLADQNIDSAGGD